MNAPPIKLLIVDDDPLAIQSLYNVVDEFGAIRFATSGHAALLLMAEDEADLVLLDANMPDLDGFATCRLLKNEYPETPVIFVTAASDPASEVQALEAGAVDFISKPLNPPVVKARVRTQLQLKENSDRLRQLSKLDPLTGLANRRALDEQLEKEWRRGMRDRTPLAMLMLDIDHFKTFNDHYGHMEGDRALKLVADTLKACASRVGDLVARFGGEEFSVLLWNCDQSQALTVAEKIRQAVANLEIPHAKSAVASHVTVSVGVAGGVPTHPSISFGSGAHPHGALPELPSQRALFDRADAALYLAKQDGRNRVMVHAEPGG
jgi:diguanylate cyclase (GGDEF)-like protein